MPRPIRGGSEAAEIAKQAQRTRQARINTGGGAEATGGVAPSLTTATGGGVEATEAAASATSGAASSAVGEQEVLIEGVLPEPQAKWAQPNCVVRLIAACPLPFLLVVGTLMFWRAGVGICGPDFPWDFSFEEGCAIPEVSTAVDDFRTRGTLISLRENTATVFKGMQASGTLVDRIPLDCAQVPNGKAVADACSTCEGTCGLCAGEPICSERVWRGQVAGCDRCICCPDPDAVASLAVPTAGRRLSSAPAPAARLQPSAAGKRLVHPAGHRRTQTAAACGMPALADLQPGVIKKMCPEGATSCADGSEFSFLVRRGSSANERKVMVDFMGGGACWNEECLSAESRRFQSVWAQLNLLDGEQSSSASALLSLLGFSAFAFDEANPIGDTSTWTYVFVPYCTQDIHLGTYNQTYTDPVSGETRHMRHNGHANTKAAMDWVTASFPVSAPPLSLAFVGCSAGAAAVIITEAARASVTYAGVGTRIVAVGDSPSNTLTDAFVNDGLTNWGVAGSLEELAGVTNFSPSPLRRSLLTDAVVRAHDIATTI